MHVRHVQYSNYYEDKSTKENSCWLRALSLSKRRASGVDFHHGPQLLRSKWCVIIRTGTGLRLPTQGYRCIRCVTDFLFMATVLGRKFERLNIVLSSNQASESNSRHTSHVDGKHLNSARSTYILFNGVNKIKSIHAQLILIETATLCHQFHTDGYSSFLLSFHDYIYPFTLFLDSQEEYLSC